MDNKFDTKSIEPGKKILHQEQVKLCGYDVRYEIWSLEGCLAESIIFDGNEIAGLTDQEIENLVKTSHLFKEGSEMSIHRLEDFTFVIFNFQIEKNTPLETSISLNEKGRSK